MNRRAFLIASALAAPISAATVKSGASVETLAEEAYIWGVPLILQERYLQLARAAKRPINRFTLATQLSTPDDKVAGPNVDTLYGFAWLDLQSEPLVLSVPDTHDRYYSIQLIDMYSNSFAYVGRRATGTKAGRYLIAEPGWKGSLPHGLLRIDAPTSRLLVLTRTLVRGQADFSGAGRSNPVHTNSSQQTLRANGSTSNCRFRDQRVPCSRLSRRRVRNTSTSSRRVWPRTYHRRVRVPRNNASPTPEWFETGFPLVTAIRN